ncbi:hypothetical protein JAAARDRAFT_31721 [Jaapia argillacea MUCL 33604]|uniref:DUF1264-domain-containing protein n=1 Tax=Jaapia argillacea MUCL 33604 TaxID=933084 RepID=A0A067Q0Z9_9AGAM|nr:hypothetical protein JAAARDRAFT_31721 [Jaapia argillacea MUCL 33604]
MPSISTFALSMYMRAHALLSFPSSLSWCFDRQDRTRHVEAHHYCTHLSEDLHQCVIYDSDEPNARLIGIEYILTEKIFKTLPDDEKKYWHSHKFEVESGVLQLQLKAAVPGFASDAAEQPAMLELQQTYGKTIHTWAIDVTPDLPLGPPNLMMAYTGDGQIDQQLLRKRDETWGMDTESKRKLRAGYLPHYERVSGADMWEETGKGLVFEVAECGLGQ